MCSSAPPIAPKMLRFRRTVSIFNAIVCLACALEITHHDVHGAGEIVEQRREPIGQWYEPSVYYVSHDLSDVCNDERCNDVADLFLASVNKSSQPCDDFFTYACGRRQNKTSSWIKEIQEILESPSIERKQTRSLAFEKKFYRSCMEQRDNDSRTKREFSRILKTSNGRNLFRRGHEFEFADWQASDGYYASLGFEHAFFNVRVTRDPENSNANIVTLAPPSPLYFYSVHSLLKYRYFGDIVSNLLEDHDQENPYVVDYEDVMEFNNALFEILPPLGMSEENATTLIRNKMTIDEWQKTYDSTNDGKSKGMNWLKVLNALLAPVGSSVTGSEKIVVNKLEYFNKLSQLLRNTPSIAVEKYVHFKFLTQISKYLNPELGRFFENVHNRSTFCINQFDNQLVGVTYEYIRRYVPREQKVYAEEVMNNVRDALMDLLLNAKWMDEETKSYATNKLKSLQMVIGYPEWQVDRAFMNSYYGNVRLNSNFFENVIKFKKSSLIHKLQGLKFPRRYDPLTMSKKSTPLIHHFEVSSHLNRIFFPTEYLNEKNYKLFSPKLPSAISYGSFGSMLGSILYDYISLTDDIKYNEYARTSDGLSKDTIEAYKLKEKCLTNQLSHYNKSVSKFNWQLAYVINRDTVQVDKIYEKISGLRAAFEAYKRVQSSNEELLPGFERMSRNQLFFLSYAERICEIGDIYDNYDAYETSLKVNGVVSNLEDFSDTFRCSKNSKMNRETKCELFT
ncbi:endothelin-converting enzyme 1-like isoform X2 [Copidosoma floridanum]|uniref:endothelin-converting enzyme 1-like isoform X2 n=1 Tax=Copidosoma floridanum TaxID=29053 RepID=UPI0006C965E2|nr:endothelin-converting enzyme 1-like isoform X2 [Copidosoma floridanum]